MLHDFLHGLLPMYLGWVERWGYAGVAILMALESSIFPVPSEVVIPPAAVLAASGSRMTLTGVILAGTFGSWLGSAITYAVALTLGRRVVLRWGRYFFVPPDKLERAERFVRRYEAGGVFFARLLPVIRHLISIPAGLVRMGFAKFSLLTSSGAAIWCSVLAWLGGRVGERLRAGGLDPLDPEALVAAVQRESHLLVAAVVGVCALYFLVLKLTAPAPRRSARR
jgi:membrane protein DedA with SNARE-associated domain